ncbi:MAG: hypothetical protein ACJAQ9_000871, partial [Ilumatobacter sp.]
MLKPAACLVIASLVILAPLSASARDDNQETGTSAGTDSGGTVTAEAGTGDLVLGVVYTSDG